MLTLSPDAKNWLHRNESISRSTRGIKRNHRVAGERLASSGEICDTAALYGMKANKRPEPKRAWRPRQKRIRSIMEQGITYHA